MKIEMITPSSKLNEYVGIGDIQKVEIGDIRLDHNNVTRGVRVTTKNDRLVFTAYSIFHTLESVSGNKIIFLDPKKYGDFKFFKISIGDIGRYGSTIASSTSGEVLILHPENPLILQIPVKEESINLDTAKEEYSYFYVDTRLYKIPIGTGHTMTVSRVDNSPYIDFSRLNRYSIMSKLPQELEKWALENQLDLAYITDSRGDSFDVIAVESGRLKGNKLISLGKEIELPSDVFIYQCRHDDDGDWATPITVENRVLVNRWGTIISPVPILWDEKDVLGIIDFCYYDSRVD